MKILVCGGRDFSDKRQLMDELEKVHAQQPVTLVIQGGARGADNLARRWAEWRGIDVAEYPANWNKHGKAAGHRRNAAMLKHGEPELVVAFSGGRGTDMMCKLAIDANVGVWRIKPRGPNRPQNR